MGFFLFLIGLFVFLIVYAMLSSVIKIALYLTTKHKYSNIRLFIPTILTLIDVVFLTIISLFAVEKFTGKTMYEILFNQLLKTEGISTYFNVLLPIGIIYVFFIIFMQSLTYFCVNIDLKRIFDFIRFKIKKILRIIPKKNSVENYNISQNTNIESIESKVTEYDDKIVEQNSNAQIILEDEKESINFSTSLIASLFTFCLITFSIIILFIIGFAISDKVASIILGQM